MLPALIPALINVVATVIPEVGKLFLDPNKTVPQRNIEAATIALQKIAAATRPADAPSWNEQQAVTAIVTDPLAASRARAALLDDYDRLLGMTIKGVQADDASRDVAAARAKSDEAMQSATWPLIDRAFWLLASILAGLILFLCLQTYFDPDHEPNQLALGLLISVVTVIYQRWGQIYDYRFGSSSGSKASGDSIRAIAEKK